MDRDVGEWNANELALTSITIDNSRLIVMLLLLCHSKSSLVRLLYRFYESKTGDILIGGQKIRDVDLDSLRKSIAIVPQVSENSPAAVFYGLRDIYIAL